jgi:hypothetical protein
MKKIGILAMCLVLALGAMGVGFAKWSETLEISGLVNTGEVDIQFSDQWSNDPSMTGVQQRDPSVGGDPTECGYWAFGLIDDPDTWEWMGAVGDKEVASIDCELVPGIDDDPVRGTDDYAQDKMTVTVYNGYPCYFGNVAFSIDNIGTIPVKVEALRLTKVSKDGVDYPLATPIDLTAFVRYYVDFDPILEITDNPGDPDDYEFSIELSELAYGQQIDPVPTIPGSSDPVGAGVLAIPGDICVHVEQAADELQTYDFTIEIVASQWNEVY